MKIALSVIGALIGPVVGFLGMFFVYCPFPSHSCGIGALGERFEFSLFVGAPLGLVTFCLIGLWLGCLLEPRAKNNVATADEELKMLAERSGIVRVRVELTSYFNHDAIRGDLERTGFLEIDERTLLEKVSASGSVKWVTGTINAARIKELTALSFVKSVESKGSMDVRGG